MDAPAAATARSIVRLVRLQRKSGPAGGTQILRPPAPGKYQGGGGPDPSIVVIVNCPGQGNVVYHFGTSNGDAAASLREYAWFPNCHAIICGGDNSTPSNCLMSNIVQGMKDINLKLDGFVNSSGCLVGSDNRWYSGAYQKSEDKKCT